MELTPEDGPLVALLLLASAVSAALMVYLVLKRRSLKPKHYRRPERPRDPTKEKSGPVKPKGGPRRSKRPIRRGRGRRRDTGPAWLGVFYGGLWSGGGDNAGGSHDFGGGEGGSDGGD